MLARRLPSDQLESRTKNTIIGGKPFTCCSTFGEKNQYGLDRTGGLAAPEPQSLLFVT
jgi:hypothetical protein